ncbi:hypothetical protein NKH48_06130 [Mesorhizobium sp. M1233]
MPDWTAESEAAFDAYVDALIGVIGHADRAEPLKGRNKVRRETGRD